MTCLILDGIKNALWQGTLLGDLFLRTTTVMEPGTAEPAMFFILRKKVAHAEPYHDGLFFLPQWEPAPWSCWGDNPPNTRATNFGKEVFYCGMQFGYSYCRLTDMDQKPRFGYKGSIAFSREKVSFVFLDFRLHIPKKRPRVKQLATQLLLLLGAKIWNSDFVFPFWKMWGDDQTLILWQR